jgi:hypothetical protein
MPAQHGSPLAASASASRQATRRTAQCAACSGSGWVNHGHSSTERLRGCQIKCRGWSRLPLERAQMRRDLVDRRQDPEDLAHAVGA